MADNAADVAEDYRQALEDLTVNSRIEIATLTNIARENANHGFAIAEVLQNHIKKVPPSRTLPALYVLDSIVKNVPTPYALYFGPKLYSIFMGAYTKVDNATRRKMDEMLKTWKEPVPGSISTKPVFPIEQVRPIENALMAARSAAFAATQNSYQGQQQLLRGRQPVPSRETPTPPTGRPYQPPPQQPPYPGPNGHQPGAAPVQPPYPAHPVNGTSHVIPHRTTPQPAPPAGPYPPYQQQPALGQVYGAPQQGISIDKLKDDIQQLIVVEKADFAQDPYNTSKQTRLKALLDLQTIIQSQDMPQDQLMIIRDRVAELAVKTLPQLQPQPQAGQVISAGPSSAAAVAAPSTTYPGAPYSSPTPPVVSQQPTPVPASAAAVVAAALARPPSAAATTTPPPAAGKGAVSIDSILGPGALATLLSAAARKSVTPQQTPTPQPASLPAPVPPAAAAIAAATRSPPPQRHAEPTKPAGPSPPPPSDPSALLAMLRQSGLIKSGPTSTPPPAAAPAMPGLPGMAGGFQSLAGVLAEGIIQLNPASLKIFRPHLIAQLHEDLGPPCTQCGRRFKTDESGRRKKTAHMDWHFRVHQRMTDAEKRGQHRSWYVDELDWIRSREAIDADYVAPQDPSTSSTALSSDPHSTTSNPQFDASTSTATINTKPAAAAAAKLPYIPVPEDSSRMNNTCPICQERFEMKWLDEAQEWVWTDAVKVGERVYHASCHAEAAGAMSTAYQYQGSSGSASGQQQQQGARRVAIPDGTAGVLGKRKAEDEAGGLRGKIKTEGY
ncbi:protein PCF11 [Achaetomium macrosporum]|uniref:Protein PCF11 n=1 Tax=Achaetomium macrosporum TaxID=79813 RepID=A0AAN7CE43_9PEZI|nr:protein PCF11 [Achaetomium macrosporum]